MPGSPLAAIVCGGATLAQATEPGVRLHVAINQWSVNAIRKHDKQKANISFEEELAELAASGINGLEPSLGSADQVGPLVAQLKKHGLEMRSIYTGSALYDPRKSARKWSGSLHWPRSPRKRARGSSSPIPVRFRIARGRATSN